MVVDDVVHLVAGGAGGTVGAIVTCPLEVLKTRMQSTQYREMMARLSADSHPAQRGCVTTVTCPGTRRGIFSTPFTPAQSSQVANLSTASFSPKQPNVVGCLKYIVEKEGIFALWKGLGPNLVGVMPSRAVYFSVYNHMKAQFMSGGKQEAPYMHLGSAFCAGITSCTVTNPIWLVKTRVQLDITAQKRQAPVLEIIRNIYRTDGPKGFYKGVTASYYGVSETMLHWLLYEAMKKNLTSRLDDPILEKERRDNQSLASKFAEFALIGATSKCTATCICYPHEVARTRLREGGKVAGKYLHFWQTLGVVFREEGYRGLYGGLVTQLLRQAPNAALMMATYEMVVFHLSKAKLLEAARDPE